MRGKVVTANKAQPGATIDVQIESIDPVRGEVRFRTV